MDYSYQMNKLEYDEHRKMELLSAIEKQTQNIKMLNTHLETEKAKLVKMNEELVNLTKKKEMNVNVLESSFYNYPRIYEPLRF